MRFLIALSLVALAASFPQTETSNEATKQELAVVKPSESKVGTCSRDCAFKTLFFSDDGFGTGLVKLFITSNPNDEEIDEVFDICHKNSESDDDTCSVFFGCLELEFQKRNITTLFSE